MLLNVNAMLFGDNPYKFSIDTQWRFRMPDAFPSSDAVQNMCNKSLSRICKVARDPYHMRYIHGFVSPRNALVTRLTLFNGKRAGLTLAQFDECEKNKWFQRHRFTHSRLSVVHFRLSVLPGTKKEKYSIFLTSAHFCTRVLQDKRYKEKDDEADDVRKWISAFEGERNVMFGDATCKFSIDTQWRFRMPEAFPSSDAVQKVCNEKVSGICKVARDPYHVRDIHGFVSLRNALVTRLTLFNGKRAPLTLAQFNEREKNKWIQKDDPRWKHDAYVQHVTQEIKVAYQVVREGGCDLCQFISRRFTMKGCKLMAWPVS